MNAVPGFTLILWIASTSLLVSVSAYDGTSYGNKNNTKDDLFKSKDTMPRAATHFTLKMLKYLEMSSNSTNIVFSPASIAVLLAVLQQGAGGTTASQIWDLLRLNSRESRLGYGTVRNLQHQRDVIFHWGNRMYIKSGLHLNSTFRSSIRGSLDVDVIKMNFGVPSPQASANEINQWIEKMTHNEIKKLVDASSISTSTIMMLVNAIYFRGTWMKQFKKEKSKLGAFYTETNSTVNVTYMAQKDKYYGYKDRDLGLKWLQLPFTNSRLAMYFIVPTKKNNLRTLLKTLKNTDLADIFKSRFVSEVKIRLPRFKLSEKMSLVDTLSQLGAPDMFTPKADFTYITHKEKLSVSDMIHQANIEVDEKGATAAASTIVQLSRMRTPTMSFNANRPFLFFLVDTKYKIPLFCGKVGNPNM